jgi:hypothetical protein
VAEPTEAELWRSVEVTVRDVLLPAISDEWARTAAVQLVGLARYAASRPADRTTERARELTAALDALAGNRLVDAHWRAGAGGDPFVAAGRVLAAAVVLDHDPAADQVRAVLRPVVTRHLDDELAVTGGLVPAFRGRLDP